MSQTMAGTLTNNTVVTIPEATLPKFFRTRKLQKIKMRSFSTSCRYDVIIGRDLLNEMGIKINFEDHVIQWEDSLVSMRQYEEDKEDEPPFKLKLQQQFHDEEMDDNDVTFILVTETHPTIDQRIAVPHVSTGYRSKIITESHYQKIHTDDVVEQLTHIKPHKKDNLKDLLKQFPILFSGRFGRYKHEKIKLEVNPQVQPHVSRAYPIPKQQLIVFKNDLDR